MIDVHLDNPFEMTPRHDQHPIKTLGPDRSHPAFREGVCLRCLDWRLNDLKPLAPEHLIERRCELFVPVSDEELKTVISVVEVGHSVARLLRDPGGVGARAAPAEMDPPARMLDEEQDIDPLEQEGLDREQVARDDAVSLLAQELTPGNFAPARGRTQSVTPEQGSDRRRRDRNAESLELTLNAPVTPPRVLSRKAQDERLDIRVERRPSIPPRRITPPLATHQLPVPAQKRLGRDEEARPARARHSSSTG